MPNENEKEAGAPITGAEVLEKMKAAGRKTPKLDEVHACIARMKTARDAVRAASEADFRNSDERVRILSEKSKADAAYEAARIALLKVLDACDSLEFVEGGLSIGERVVINEDGQVSIGGKDAKVSADEG